MEISGPSFVSVKEGRPFKKFEVSVRERAPRGVKNTLYWFRTKEAAETYIEYLRIINGIEELNAAIASPKTYLWEKADLIKFRDTLDPTPLKKKIARIKFTSQVVFVEMRYSNNE